MIMDKLITKMYSNLTKLKCQKFKYGLDNEYADYRYIPNLTRNLYLDKESFIRKSRAF